MPTLGLFRRKQKKPAGRRDAAAWRQRRRRFAIVLAVAVVLGGGWWSWSSGLVGRLADEAGAMFDRQVAGIGLAVTNVLVAGRNETTKQQVLEALDVETGQSILSFDPDVARSRLVALGWVADARVERRLPNTIIIHILERRPLALWQQDGQHRLIDRHGVVITRQILGRFAELPVVIGPDAPANAAALIDVLAQQPALYNQVEAAVRVGGRRWTLHLKNGIRIDLPETQPADAWNRLAALAREHKIFDRDVKAIDLRLPDRLVVRVTPAAAEQLRAPGEDT